MENDPSSLFSFDPSKNYPSKQLYSDYEFPKVTLLVPTYMSGGKIATTIDSILCQHYPDFEIIVIDARSTDRTHEEIKSYREEKIRIYTVSDYQPYAMINLGISQAEGFYVQVLYPGDFLIHCRCVYPCQGVAG